MYWCVDPKKLWLTPAVSSWEYKNTTHILNLHAFYLNKYGSYTGTVLGLSLLEKNYVLQCYPCLTVEDDCVAFQSNSWASLWAMRRTYLTDKPPTRLFCSCSYFYSHFHLHTSHNLTRCAIYSTCKRFCFHYGHNRKLHALSPPSSKKWRHHAFLL